ncbi:MAG: AmmeMemoRadiSam system radical SAM enzyme [Armatimonadetes bacterium]|nr:AmmeMemoRadiSam system radical SAM enzyme [Armatimonadota bacterium]NIM24607.1 AmmeMemoRadiSam system radical SAM enzyme [Armatimonadota bacterium]NIM68483.1 AmmeMemoRadiSam system radical SAM enzyme [Armatimonadota bacterium]NIM76868.1 AmmeMemoRadiSam system radical SAM enzyme [Armatimonadota bacterium]NIN06680.1 AmmeMemoRadiSam system radical SAM enzyme [Armatimonadota bacterium]
MADPQKKAMYWEPIEEGRVHCRLCPQSCRISDGAVGVCRVRKNGDGVLRSLNYGRVTSVNFDPMEKKPLFHFFPGSSILSIGTLGCNLSCGFCQNWQISQEEVPTQSLDPQQALRQAEAYPDNLGIAYTYNEPFIWYEYVLETALLIREAGQKNVLVTNGYVEEEPLRELLPFIDAMNVDVKSMRDEFYRKLCRGKAGPAKRTVEIAHDTCHVEVTNLVIPGWNDSDEDFREMVDWVAGVDPNIPLHFSRYHPAYQMTEPATPANTLYRARDIAREKLPYVYLGNIPGEDIEDTICPSCRHKVVERRGFGVRSLQVKDGKCAFCDATIPIVGN